MAQSAPKISMVFHETIPLRRPSIQQVLSFVINWPDLANCEPNFKDFYSKTSLGTNEVKSVRRFAYATGLLDENGKPTAFGRLVSANDNGMSEVNTQWVMHYYLMAQHWSGPVFWRYLSTELFNVGNSLTTAKVVAKLREFIHQGENHKTIADDSMKATAIIFLNAYEYTQRTDMFNTLKLLKKEGGQYIVCEPEPPSVNVFAYALADHWDSVWKDRSGVDLREVTGENGPAATLFLNSSETDYYLAEMQEAGLLEVHRRVPPYQVVRLWNSPQMVLERLYD